MTKKAEELQRRIQATKEQADKYAKENSIHTHKSEFRGCKNCGSKLAVKYIKGEVCPLCGVDLRSETVVKMLKGYETKIKQLTKELAIEAKKAAKVIFCKKRVVGIKSKDILKEIEKRKNKKNYKKVKKTC